MISGARGPRGRLWCEYMLPKYTACGVLQIFTIKTGQKLHVNTVVLAASYARTLCWILGHLLYECVKAAVAERNASGRGRATRSIMPSYLATCPYKSCFKCSFLWLTRVYA